MKTIGQGYVLCMCFFLLLQMEATAQIISTVVVDKDSMDIGSKVQLAYKITLPRGAQIKALDYRNLDSLSSLVDTSSIPYYAEVEWTGDINNYKKKYVIVRPNRIYQTANGQREYRDTLIGEFWDIGIFSIPLPRIVLDSNSMQRIMPMQSPVIRVLPPLDITNPDTTTAILKIKDILVTEKTWRDYLHYLWWALGFLIIGLLTWLYLRRKKKAEGLIVEEEEVIKEPAHIIATRQLKVLEEQALWTKGQTKEYHSELTHIIREYLENRYEINALESTTDQISKALRKHNLTDTHQTDLNGILQIADLVKFAKAETTGDINESFLVKAKAFVEQTKGNISDTLTDPPSDAESTEIVEPNESIDG